MAASNPLGGNRLSAAVQRRRDAKRPKDYRPQQAAEVAAVFTPDDSAWAALSETGNALRILARQAATDPGAEPEYRREQAARIYSQLGKLIDPMRLVADLRAELQEAHAILVRLKDPSHAAPQLTADSGRSAEADPH